MSERRGENTLHANCWIEALPAMRAGWTQSTSSWIDAAAGLNPASFTLVVLGRATDAWFPWWEPGFSKHKGTNMPETLEQVDALKVLQKVREMREAQREYFQYRYKAKLERAMQLENEVDELLEQLVPSGQRKLFE